MKVSSREWGQRLLAIAVAASAAATMGAADWPTYLNDNSRDGGGADTAISAANAAQLVKQWAFATGGVVAASASVVGSRVYVGSWDGFEYALDAGSGALLWKTYLGVTTDATCSSSPRGVTSAATLVNGTLYVGGGDAYWYALDATSGAIQWKVYTGDNSASGGHYNWSSPLLYNGKAYIGVASNCDNPLVQGQLLQVDLATHQVTHTLNVVPSGQVGGSIWTSPAVDPATNTVFVTTGNSGGTQQYAPAILAVDASALTIRSAWQLPASQQTTDSDWGTTPTLFSDSHGNQLVGAINKNGYVYALGRNNLAAGPLWQVQIARPGECPECGDGSVSSMAFGSGRLYAAAGATTIAGAAYGGSVRALDPATGAFIWQHGTANPVIPALAFANGLVMAGAGSTLQVLNAAGGSVLYSYAAGATMYGAPSVAHGEIFIGSVDHKEYAFGLPQPASTCPAGWSCADVGNPTPAGSQSVSGSTWTIRGGGLDIQGIADRFHWIWRGLASDGSMSARVLTQSASDPWAKAGVMFRSSSNPGAPNYTLLVTPAHGVTVQYRATAGGNTVTAEYPGTVPIYVRVTRSGTTYAAYTSTDGSTWHLLPNSGQNLPNLAGAVLEGLAVTSHNTQVLSTVTMDSVIPS